MKKVISILLAVMLVASVAVVAVNAWSVTDEGVPNVETAVSEAGITQAECRRYYFQMPNGSNGPVATKDVTYLEPVTDETGAPVLDDDGKQTYREVLVCKAGEHTPSWYNDYTEGAGIYWWGGGAIPAKWAGYAAMAADAPNVFYADVPFDKPNQVTTVIWNNGVDGGTDQSQEIYYKAAQTIDLNVEWRFPNEEPGYPDGIPEEEGFNNKIYIISPEDVSVNALSLKMTCGGRWYYYYGNGCYGLTNNNIDGLNVDECCENPDHRDADGNHVIPGAEPEYVRGDADGDGDVTIMDATRIQNWLAKKLNMDGTAYNPEQGLSRIEQLSADADGDGDITIMDATRIQNFLAKKMNMDGSTPYVDPKA